MQQGYFQGDANLGCKNPTSFLTNIDVSKALSDSRGISPVDKTSIPGPKLGAESGTNPSLCLPDSCTRDSALSLTAASLPSHHVQIYW